MWENEKVNMDMINQDIFNRKLRKFAQESNHIEGIFDHIQDDAMFQKLQDFLKLEKLTVENVNSFNIWGRLRNKEWLNVRIGDHKPVEGGSVVKFKLSTLILAIRDSHNPYECHTSFETLHPYTDGNGRTGRAIWLWQMVNQYAYKLELGFLHKWYYQSLDNRRK